MTVIDFTQFGQLFIKQSWDRARDYFMNGQVRIIRKIIGDDGNLSSVFFQANNLRGQTYIGKVSFEDVDPGMFSAYCDCPYTGQGYCKHIGAAILTCLEQQLVFNAQDMPESAFEEETCELDAFVEDPKHKSPSLLGLLQIQKPQQNRSAKAAQPYRICFNIRKRSLYNDTPYHAVRHEVTDFLTIELKSRYIRKNGQPGRVSEYEMNTQHIPMNEAEQQLFHAVSFSKNAGIELGKAYSVLKNPEDIDLIAHGRKDAVVQWISIKKVYLAFEVSSVRGGRYIHYKPAISLEDEQKQKHLVEIPNDWVFDTTSENAFLNCVQKSDIYVLEKIPLQNIGILEQIILKNDEFSYHDITQMQEELDAAFIEITLPVKKMEYKKLIPSVRIYVQSLKEETTVFPYLLYDDRVEVSYEDDREVLIYKEDNTDQVTVYQRLEWMEHDRLNHCLCDVDLSMDSHGEMFTFLPLYDFLSEYAPVLHERGVDLRFKDNKKKISSADKMKFIVSSGIDWLDLKVEIDEKPVMFQSLLSANGLLETKDGFCILDTEAMEKIQALTSYAECNGESLSFSRYHLHVTELLGDTADFSETDAAYQRMLSAVQRLKKGFKQRDVNLPKEFKAVLRGYQKKGLSWLNFLKSFGFGGILADDMGLGKTVQAIALMCLYLDEGCDQPFLVSAPVSTLSNWRSELERFAPHIDIHWHIGNQREEDLSSISSGVVLTSYQTLLRDILQFQDHEWALVVLDESQALKNPATRTYKAVKKLDASQVLAMSGTPIENSIQELWSIMNILNPGLLGTRKEFLKKYRSGVNSENKVVIESLRKSVAPFILRRRKIDVAKDLPPREEILINVKAEAEEQAFYDDYARRLRLELEELLAYSENPLDKGIFILTALSKLRQAAIAPELVGGPAVSAKLDMILDKAVEAALEEHKVLIFSQYTKVLKLIEKRLSKEGWTYAYLDGSLSVKKRQKAIENFQKDAQCCFFLISLKAGGSGINLTEADYVFIVDPWWNPAVEAQAIDRSHRIGQTKSVFAYKFINRGTVEEKVLELQQKKQRLVENIMEADTSVFGSMNKEEILELFS